MKSDLFDDINTIKKIYKESSGICFFKDVLLKDIIALILLVIYILLTLVFISLQYCFKDNPIKSNISIVVFLITNFIILLSFSDIIDSHIKEILDIDKKTKYNPFHLTYLLFIRHIIKYNISNNKLKLIIKQLESQNKGYKIHFPQYVTLLFGIIILLFEIFIQKTFDKNIIWTIVIIVSVFIIITAFDILYFVFTKGKYINDGIIKNLKQYMDCKEYEMAE